MIDVVNHLCWQQRTAEFFGHNQAVLCDIALFSGRQFWAADVPVAASVNPWLCHSSMVALE